MNGDLVLELSELQNDVRRLKPNTIDKIFVDMDVSPSRFNGSPYVESSSHYMITLKNDHRKRRVYVQQIGNSAVLFIKTKHGLVMVETELYRKMDELNDDA